MRLIMVSVGLLLLSSLPLRLHAQSTRSCEARDSHEDGRYSVAEARDETLAHASFEKINPSPNGSVIIHGSDRSDVQVHACIRATAPSEQEAHSLASQVRISKGSGNIEPVGPTHERDRHWSVSYEIWLPRQSNLDVSSVNGAIKLEDVKGNIKANNVNGGMELTRLGGEVNTSTVNGGVKVELAGTTWEGQGLTVSTTNGGVRVSVPAAYSANVESSTVNGGIHCDFPVTVQGRLQKHVSFQLGGGGAEIHASTVNGGIHFTRGA